MTAFDAHPIPREPADIPWWAGAARPRPWHADAASLIDFVMSVRLPAQPFEFRPGEKVCEPDVFLAALRRDVEQGPHGPRGALVLADVQRLRELFGRPSPPAGGAL